MCKVIVHSSFGGGALLGEKLGTSNITLLSASMALYGIPLRSYAR